MSRITSLRQAPFRIAVEPRYRQNVVGDYNGITALMRSYAKYSGSLELIDQTNQMACQR
jgi:hypothetical protein